jgi:GNAT superfamily N-acetyltransferase
LPLKSRRKEDPVIQEARTAVSIRPLLEPELDEADQVFRLAFGTFLGLSDPLLFMGDAGYVRTRWRSDPSSAFAAELDGRLAGSNFVTNWGSVGFFGPLSVRPDLWDKAIGSRLVEPAMQRFAEWKTEHIGLFTWSHSPKHAHLYQKFGFWPRFLTSIMSKSIVQRLMLEERQVESGWSRLSDVTENDRQEILAACRDVAEAIYGGLDLSSEINAVVAQNLGDVVLLHDGSRLAGFAVCHQGPGTEAGSGACYVKFAAIRPGPEAGRNFERMLDACESFAARQGMQVLIAGVNVGRHEAYRVLLQRGFRTEIQGVTMHQQNEPGYSRPGVYVIDDWR